MGKSGNENEEAETQLGVEGMAIVPSWGTGRQGWGTGITTAAITKSEMVTGIELKEDSELRPNPLRICEWRGLCTSDNIIHVLNKLLYCLTACCTFNQV